MENLIEKNKPFFSIVMPAYNAEKYIRKAVKSIQRQTFTDWELIVVDDCSTDGSGTIIEQLRAKDGRLQVLRHEKNQGVSAARNHGMDASNGQYIWFVDADDKVDETLLKKVYDSLQNNPAQIVIFGLIEEYYDKNGRKMYEHQVSHQECCFSEQTTLRKEMIYLEQETLYGYPWNKIYHLSYLRKLKLRFADYKDAKFIEDIMFNIEYCMDIERMNILAACPYRYAKRMSDNLTNEFVPDYFKFHKKRIQLLYGQHQYWNMDTTEVKQILGSLYARYILSTLQRNCDKRSGMNHAERVWWCRSLFGEKLFNELIPTSRAKNSVELSLLLLFLKWKMTVVCLLMGRAVYIVKNKLPMVYSKVKSGR